MMRSTPNPKHRRKRQIRAIATRLIPTLDGGADGTGDDGEVQDLGDAPLVLDLIAEDLDLGGVEGLGAVNLLVARRVLGDERALFQDGDVLLQALVVGKGFDIAEELGAGYAEKGVPDPVGCVSSRPIEEPEVEDRLCVDVIV